MMADLPLMSNLSIIKKLACVSLAPAVQLKSFTVLPMRGHSHRAVPRLRLSLGAKAHPQFVDHKVLIGKVYILSTSVFPCQHYSTTTLHSFVHLSPTLYNLGN